MSTIFLALSGYGLAWVFLEMALTYALARRLRNAGIVDVVWSIGFAGLMALWLWLLRKHTPNDSMRIWVLGTMVILWSLRLGLHLGRRVAAHHPVEDVRYAELRREWGARAEIRMFGFFQLQGLLQFLLSLPWLWVMTAIPSKSSTLSHWEWIGLATWVLAWLGESIADLQLARFRGNPANRGRVCNVGLWAFSRHPNYFFEWLIWVAYWIYALATPWGWVGIYAPLLMLYFLLRVTGIPMTEALSVRSKGEAYREYQRTTSAFVPWFRRP